MTRRKRTKMLRDRAFSGSVDSAALPSGRHVRVPSKTLKGDVALLNMLTAIKQESVDLDAKLTREVRPARRAASPSTRLETFALDSHWLTCGDQTFSKKKLQCP